MVIRLFGAVVHDNVDTGDLPYLLQLVGSTQRLHDRGYTNDELLHLSGFTTGVTWSCYDVDNHIDTMTDLPHHRRTRTSHPGQPCLPAAATNSCSNSFQRPPTPRAGA
ncbi:hypothetical protein [Amycolatopsis sp. CA-126428]|uniref:hypothetical protein n=1 Tax=Amycolatopsis sp. CA-126428 TaxID=2073158 RepID=UPI000CD0DFA3|nr:hypothetical protein [Amycolatopsis sp. CA-126428]